jgi:hypothetical protein
VKKKEESTIAMTKATTHNQKVQKTISYACPICGLNGHKMIDYPKFVEMQKMFQGKNVSNTNGKSIVNVKIVTTVLNVVDVNVTTKSSIRKNKCSMNEN